MYLELEGLVKRKKEGKMVEDIKGTSKDDDSETKNPIKGVLNGVEEDLDRFTIPGNSKLYLR